MSSARLVASVAGRFFGGAVSEAGPVSAATAPAERRLPDNVIALLMELQPNTPEETAERDGLVSDRHELNLRTQAFVDRTLAQARADLETTHERAKEAVREQIAVVDDLKSRAAQDAQEAGRAQNALTRAQTEAFDAAQALKSLSRFSARKDIEAAEKVVDVANKKLQSAEAKAAELVQALNYLKLTTIPPELKKLDELSDEERRLEAVISGKPSEFLGLQIPGRA